MFVAVAEARSFRGAADRLGVTRSAVSQSLRKLENRLGIALVQRTTRSVSLTEAGERLYGRVAPALSEVAKAVQAASDRQGRPSGVLRLAVSSIAEAFLSGPLLASFLDAHPEVRLDIVVTDEELDIVAKGFDAGVRLGEVIEQDMIAVPVSGTQRQLVVAAPGYVARAGRPEHPRELPAHRCIGWRPAPGVAPYRWEFGEHGREFDVAVDPEVAANDMGLMIRLACAGEGLTFGLEETFRPWLERGELVAVLEEYCSIFAGFFLFYPSRRNLAPKLRALAHGSRRRPAGPLRRAGVRHRLVGRVRLRERLQHGLQARHGPPATTAPERLAGDVGPEEGGHEDDLSGAMAGLRSSWGGRWEGAARPGGSR